MAGCHRLSLLLGLGIWLCSAQAVAQPEDYTGLVAGEKPVVLHLQTRGPNRPTPLPKKSPLVSLEDLRFTGPEPSHPFVLGNFATDGQWGLVQGYVQVISGKDAALQLAWADNFELEGVIEHAGLGGWFFLVGWDQGRGYALSNVLMKESGSPWFISEFRGNKAIPDRTVQHEMFEWKGEQTFRLTIQQKLLSLDVGRFHVLDRQPLENYSPGRIILGVYDTRYGPKPLRVRSLKIRSLPADPAAPPAAAEGEPNDSDD